MINRKKMSNAALIRILTDALGPVPEKLNNSNVIEFNQLRRSKPLVIKAVQGQGEVIDLNHYRLTRTIKKIAS